MPFGQSSVNAPPTADAAAAARWAGREGVRTSQLRNACPASDAQTAVDALEKAHPDCHGRRRRDAGTNEIKAGTSIAGRTIRLVRRQKDNQAPLYRSPLQRRPGPGGARTRAEAARLLEDESDAGIAFREARGAHPLRRPDLIKNGLGRSYWGKSCEGRGRGEGRARSRGSAAEEVVSFTHWVRLEEEGPRGAVWRFEEDVLIKKEDAGSCGQQEEAAHRRIG